MDNDDFAAYKHVLKRTSPDTWLLESFEKTEKEWKPYYTARFRKENDTTYTEVKTFQNGDIVRTNLYSLKADKKGFFIRRIENNKIECEGYSLTFFPFFRTDTWKYFEPTSGRNHMEEYYVTGREVGNMYITETGEKLKNVATFPEKDPVFERDGKDLANYLATMIKFPPDALLANASGTVFITFIVDETGAVKNVRLLKGFFPSCDEEGLRVIRLTNGGWKPGSSKGKPVNVLLNVPIRFKLN
jgi:TonB family protein